MNYRLDITGQQSNTDGLEGVYTELAWDLFASEGARVESTGGIVTLPDPDPANFVAAEEVTPEIKLAWLLAQFSPEWLAAQKTMLADRFAAPMRFRADPVMVAV